MKRLPVYLRVGVGLGLLVWVVGRMDFHDVRIRLGPRLAVGMVVSLALLTVAQGLAAWRWRVIIGAAAPPWRYLLRLYLIGLFFSLFLPTSVGGDTVRATAASLRKPVDAGLAIASVVLDRGVGVLALLMYFALGMLVDTSAIRRLATTVDWRLLPWPRPWAVVAAVAGCVALIVAIGVAPRLRLAASQAHHALTRFMRSPAALVEAMGLALAVQAAYILVWAGLAHGLAWSLPAGFLFFAVPLVSLCSVAPITVAGLGVREGAWLVLLAPLGIPAPNAVAFSLLYFVCVMALAGVGGLLFALRGVGM